jgi:TonB family protein
MFVDKLQAGFLVFETQQGWVGVDLTPRQRIYLLWTFRHFRQLSMPLLNGRERTLVNELFRNADVMPQSYNPSLVIGVVEKFVPPAASDAPPVAEAAPRKEQVVASSAEILPQVHLAPPPSPKFVWPTLAWPRQINSRLKAFRLKASKVATSKLAKSKLATSRLATSKLATTLGALFLCVIFVSGWHRMQATPSSEAPNQSRLQQINSLVLPESSRLEKPAIIAGNSVAVVPPVVATQIAVAPEAEVTSAPIATESPLRASVPVVAPKPIIHIHRAASTPNLPFSAPDSGIGIVASRPPLRFAYPDYTNVRARGVVALTADVDSDGAVRNVRVVSGNRALAAAAIQSIRQWRYRPYLKDGQPVATETNIVISFFADDAISMSFPPSIAAGR